MEIITLLTTVVETEEDHGTGHLLDGHTVDDLVVTARAHWAAAHPGQPSHQPTRPVLQVGMASGGVGSY